MSNDTTVHTEQIGRFKIEIYQDNNSMNPITDWSNGCNVVVNYSDCKRVMCQQAPAYKYKFDNAQEALNMITGHDAWEEEIEDEETGEYIDNPEQPTPPDNMLFCMTGQHRHYGGLSWYAYDRENIKNIDEDDTQRADAVLWITTDDVKREQWESEEQAIKYARSYAGTINDYFAGNVYGYAICDEDGEVVDSCYGFIGDYDKNGNALSEARAVVAHMIKTEQDAANFEKSFFHV